MRKSHLLLPILALTIVLGSCSSGGDTTNPDDPAAQTPTPDPAAPAPAPAAPATPPDPTAANPDNPEGTDSELLTPTSASVAFNSVFIPSTDAQARRDATAEGRVDPFADVPFPLDVEFAPEPPATPTALGSQNVPSVSPANPSNSPNSAATTPTAPTAPAPVTTPRPAPANGGAASNGGVNTVPTINSSSEIRTALDFEPVLPALPTADLAEATEITGVITLDGVDNIMVKAPNEQYSRYVQVGDVIADGQVTVKRVDFRRNSPVVVLEQFGVEVYKEVDDVLLADRNGGGQSTAAPEASES